MPAHLRPVVALAVTACVLAAAPSPIAAQEAPIHRDSARTAPTVGMVAAGLFGSLFGMIAGIPVGNAIDRSRGYDSSCSTCTRWGAAGAAGAGATLGLAFGVHAANGGRGRFLPVLGRTSLAMAAGWGLSYAAYKAGGEGWDLVGAMAAIGLSTAIAIHTERATTPHPVPAPPAKAAPPGN